MAFITVLARRKEVATFQLRGPTSVGRSMDCDIYIPDVFVSRVHCRFIEKDGNWHILDAQSQNGIWCMGQRLSSYLLKPGDVIEIGTIAVRYNAGESDRPSHPAPLGMGLGVTELMDTVYAHDLRPSQYVKVQKQRTAEWRERVKARLAEPVGSDDFEPVLDLEPWKREEWAELDMELQIAAGQDSMKGWEPPIFNPKRQALSAAGAGTVTATPIAAKAAARKADSIDEEVEFRVADHKMAATRKAAPRPIVESCGGVTFVPYTWRDRLREDMKERLTTMWAFTKLNPQIAAAILIGVAMLLFFSVKYAPIKSGPHYFIDPEAAVAQSAK